MILESARLALGRLRANVVRSALTVLGVVIGVGAIVTLVAGGLPETVVDGFASLPTNGVTV